MRFSVSIMTCFLILFSCKQETAVSTKQKSQKENVVLKYAKGFSIINHGNYKEIKVTSPWPESDKSFTYLLVQKGDKIPNHNKQDIVIQVPIEKVVVMSTTNIPTLEYLNIEDRLVGFPNTNYISSEKTLKNIKEGRVKDLSSDLNINMELLLELNPELIIGFSVNGNNKTLNQIEKYGIPIVLDGAWTEQHPLGRAEWIKLKAAFFNKEKAADSIFGTIESNYLKAKKLARNASHKPTILSGSLYKDVWNIPGGKSYLAKYFEDANTNYLWKDTNKSGSMQLNFESVLEKGQKAELWIGCGSFDTKQQMDSKNKGYSLFQAYKNKKIYSYTNQRGPNGGLLYYELGPLRPDIILKDIIKIAHPELLKDYEPFFYKVIE